MTTTSPLKYASENEAAFPETGPVKIGFVRSGFLTRHPCHVCGGCTEKVSVLAEGPERFRVCETCLKEGDIDLRLAKHAAQLQAQADFISGLIGRLQVPSYEEWEEAQATEDRLFLEEDGERQRERAQMPAVADDDFPF
jgi:hypothetical protein